MNNSRDFIKLETIGAKLLLGATIFAILLSNTPWYTYYNKIFTNTFILYLGTLQIPLNFKFLINEVLMSFFFLVAGLEIKFEFLQGSLNTFNKAILPVIAAIGGMIVPALIYILFNYYNPINLRGWAIPTATDIAFSLGVLFLLGSRVPASLKTFLMTLAIIDDLVAIIIIAIFYTNHLSLVFLILSLFFLALLCLMNQKGITRIVPYMLIGIFLWCSLLFAGIHPTLAGVALSFFIPLYIRNSKNKSPLYKLKKLIHPFVALGVLPLFAFANAGISIFHISIQSFNISIILGILVSLFLGKQLGIFASSWIAVKFRIAKLPEKVRMLDLYAIGIICGIGFTISLFIGALAFGDINSIYMDSVKLGVLSGSLLSGITGFLLLFCIHKMKGHKPSPL